MTAFADQRQLDLDAVFTAGEFDEAFSWQPLSGTPAVEVRGIMHEAWVKHRPGSVPVDATAPRVICRATEVAGIKGGDTMVRLNTGVAYEVVGPEPDGIGTIGVVLEKI